jgi:hypothetical protein
MQIENYDEFNFQEQNIVIDQSESSELKVFLSPDSDNVIRSRSIEICLERIADDNIVNQKDIEYMSNELLIFYSDGEVDFGTILRKCDEFFRLLLYFTELIKKNYRCPLSIVSSIGVNLFKAKYNIKKR